MAKLSDVEALDHSGEHLSYELEMLFLTRSPPRASAPSFPPAGPLYGSAVVLYRPDPKSSPPRYWPVVLP